MVIMTEEKNTYTNRGKDGFLREFLHNDDQETDEDVQYFSLYNARCKKMKEWLKESAIKTWGEDTKIVQLNQIMESPAQTKLCVIGVLLKSMKLQPSVLKEVSEELELIPEAKLDKYIDPSDSLSIEDEFESCLLEGIKPDDYVTGVMVALFGYEADNGNRFHVEDVCFPIAAPQPPLPETVEDRYVLFVSDLGFRILDNQDHRLKDAREALVEFTNGKWDTILRQKSSEIVRIVIAGNCLSEKTREEERELESQENPSDEWNRKEIAYTIEGMKKVDSYLCELSQKIPVDFVPGQFDATTLSVPQLPISKKLLALSAQESKVISTTNPYWAEVNGVTIAGTDGRVIESVMSRTSFNEPVDVLHQTLKWRHFVPSAPDAVPAFPFQTEDPLAMEVTPHIYFAGCQKEFNTKLVEEDGRITRVITVPSFKKSQNGVMVNLRTLVCDIVSFNC